MSKGITPAYAGKRFWLCCELSDDGDHPRVCGEKREPGAFTGCRFGSPPRMRGKGKKGGSRGNPARITPAYAGKSGDAYKYDVLAGDHPRVCGEKQSAAGK